MSDETREDRGKPLRGFARLSVEERKQISSMGGRAVQSEGTAHKFTSDEARAASAKAKANRAEKREDEKS